MGVVRRDGDWRLEKRGEGEYEITYRKDVQLKILTPDYTPREFEDPFLDTVPVREVGSYTEAEGLFEEQAHGSSPGAVSLGGEDIIGSIDTSLNQDIERDLAGGDFEDNDAPPGLIAIALVLVGGIFVWTQGWQPGGTIFRVGALMTVGGLLIFGWGVVVGRSAGWDVAVERLFESGGDDSSSGEAGLNPDVETTPPASEKIKNTLIFDRAEQRCEWCGDRSDHLEVHHIEPRSEGGSNDPDNLIVLCPNHHRQADAGGISKTKLKAKVRRLPEVSTQ